LDVTDSKSDPGRDTGVWVAPPDATTNIGNEEDLPPDLKVDEADASLLVFIDREEDLPI